MSGLESGESMLSSRAIYRLCWVTVGVWAILLAVLAVLFVKFVIPVIVLIAIVALLLDTGV
jgi:hypothetical protein